MGCCASISINQYLERRSNKLIEPSAFANIEYAGFPIHRIQEAHDRWRQTYEGLQLIESYIEQGYGIPLDVSFGGMLGSEWQPRLAELPERLRSDLSLIVLPATRACCKPPTASDQLRNFEQSAVTQITGMMADAEQAKAVIGRVCTNRPTRRTKLSSLKGAQGLLASVLMILDDIQAVAEVGMQH